MKSIRESAIRLKAKIVDYPWFEQMAVGVAEGGPAIMVFTTDKREASRVLSYQWEGIRIMIMGPHGGSSLSGKVAKRYVAQVEGHKTAGISAGVIRSVEEGIEVMGPVLKVLLQSYSKEIVVGMEKSFKHYMPEDVGADFAQFLQDQGNKVVKVRPMINRFLTRDLNRNAPLLAKGMNLSGEAIAWTSVHALKLLGYLAGRAIDGGLWAAPKIKDLSLSVVNKGGDAAIEMFKIMQKSPQAIKDWYDQEMMPHDINAKAARNVDEVVQFKDLQFTISDWVALLYAAKKNKKNALSVILSHYHVEDVADEINMLFNDYLRSDLGPRRYRDLAEKVIAENADRIVWWVVVAMSKAVILNARKIEKNFSIRMKQGGIMGDIADKWQYFKQQPMEALKKMIVSPLIKSVKNMVFPQVKNMTEESLLIAIQKGIDNTEGQLSKEIGKGLAAPNHTLITQALTRVYQTQLSSLTSVVERELLPRIRGQMHPQLYDNIKLF